MVVSRAVADSYTNLLPILTNQVFVNFRKYQLSNQHPESFRNNQLTNQLIKSEQDFKKNKLIKIINHLYLKLSS